MTRIVVTKQGTEEDAEKYESLVDEVYQEPGSFGTPYLNLEYPYERGSGECSGGQGRIYLELYR